MPRAASRWAGLVFALLVLATLAAFAWSQRLKRDPLVLDRTSFVAAPVLHPKHPVHSFTPNRDCRFDAMRIRFRVTQTDHGTVQVIKPGGELVRTLARGAYLKRYTFHTYHWAGRTNDGGIAPPGRYKLRIKLLGQDRVLVPPGSMKLHRAKRNPPGRCRPGARIGNGEPNVEPKP
jgi:hypothetical protein